MKEFIENVVKQLVDKPEEVSVREIVGEKTAVYELKVWKGDMGKVLGRRGKNIDSIRTLLKAISANKSSKRVILELLEPE